MIADIFINLFHDIGLFLYTLKTTVVFILFLMFSGGIERDQWR